MSTTQKELDIQQILNLLPHRYPFLLVDRVLDYCTEGEHKTLKAVKNVSFNEPFFQGHFPEAHVMPGVLIIERRGIAKFTGVASVDGEVVCSADLMCAKRKG